jgi:hypothetical protein
MRRIVLAAFALCLVSTVFAQVDSTLHRVLPAKKETPSNDHFFLQLGYLTWTKQPDSIKTKGFPKSINVYVLLNFPFKTDPHWSVALGPGIGTDAMFFDKTSVGIAENTTAIRFRSLIDTTHFRKTKLVTAYLEAPVELRYRFNPEDDRKSVKLAVGAKVGFLISAHTKNVELQNTANQAINDFTLKEQSKHFFNKERLSVTGRVGYGAFSFFAAYGITPVFKEGMGPQVHPLTFGLTISGL